MSSRRIQPSRRRRGTAAALLGRFFPQLLERANGRKARSSAARARHELRRSIDRWAERSSARAASRSAASLIGHDVARSPNRLRGTSWVPVIAAAVVGALFLAGLRVDVIRLRLALAEAFEEELRLEQEERELTVRMRELRDPADLSRRAEDLGFRRAERLIELGTPPRKGSPPAAGPRDSRSIELASAARRPELRR